MRHHQHHACRYSPEMDQNMCEEESKRRQNPLGMDNTVIPFAILAGASLCRHINNVNHTNVSHSNSDI